ncbi:hypothetical protein BGZ46_009479 [Entomortierella lignicola]|nr:hypothetical protein BGZ46_009479 [Entomortierella lignicola]
MKIKNIFPLPPAILQQIKEELSRLGWRVCECKLQSDTRIARRCRKKLTNEKYVVLTRDPDLICYKEISTIAIPVGSKYELTIFAKQELMDYLGLPSPLHPLIAAVATTSDYVKSVRWRGIKTNCKCVCHLILDERYRDIDSNTKDAIEDRVKKIKADLLTLIGDRKKLEELDNGIEGLVRCQEHSSYNTMPSVQTNEAVKELLGLMKHKQRNLY